MSTIIRRRRSSKMQLGPYKTFELLTGEIKIVASGYTGYGNGRDTDITRFIGPEMRADWANHRDELIAFWKSGQSTAVLPDCLPWLWLAGNPGRIDTLPWAARLLD